MKAMKGLNMNRMLGSVRRRGTNSQDGASDTGTPALGFDTPEANAARSVRLFCESGGPNNSGEEVLYLPTIVEAAESSPLAAKECAQGIRKFLKKDNVSRPHTQYNAIMLMRILADNPGPTFTRNIDKQFAETVKELLRSGRDPSVKQILTETLDNFQREKSGDQNLSVLGDMWKKEQEKMAKVYNKGAPGGPRTLNAPPFDPHSQNYFSRSHNTNRGLPPPHELSSRVEEARTSAKLLTQVVQSTPPTEFLNNDLIKEFADRCQSASRSIQGYIIAQDPAPDNDTMLTLIETNEQLALAISKHQRAVLQTRKSLGLGTSTPSPGLEGVAPPPGPPPSASNPQPPPGPPPNKLARPTPALPTQKSVSPPTVVGPSNVTKLPQTNEGTAIPELASSEKIEDPFKDPTSTTHNPPFPPTTKGGSLSPDEFDKLGIEPYHPGFNPTQSYVGRQDSATAGTTMHAAVPQDDDPDSKWEGDDYEAPQPARKAPIYRY